MNLQHEEDKFNRTLDDILDSIEEEESQAYDEMVGKKDAEQDSNAGWKSGKKRQYFSSKKENASPASVNGKSKWLISLEMLAILVTLAICILIALNQKIIVATIVHASGEHIRIDYDANNSKASELSQYGEVILTADKLDPTNGRSSAQGQTSIVYQPAQAYPAGRYYVYMKGRTQKDGGELNVAFGDESDKNIVNCVLSNEEMEYYAYLELSQDRSQFYLSWSNDNSMPTISDLVVVKLKDEVDPANLKLGCAHTNHTIKEVVLGEDACIAKGNGAALLTVGTTLYYNLDNCIYAHDAAGKKKEDKLIATVQGNVKQLVYDEMHKQIVVVHDNGLSTVDLKDNTIKEFIGRYTEAPQSLYIDEEMWYVADGKSQIDVYSYDGNNLTAIKQMVLNIEVKIHQILINNDYMYVFGLDRVFIYYLEEKIHQSFYRLVVGPGVIASAQIRDTKLYMITYGYNYESDDGFKNSPDSYIGTGLVVYDLDKPSYPTVIDGWRMNNLLELNENGTAMVYGGKTLYLALGKCGFHVIRQSDDQDMDIELKDDKSEMIDCKNAVLCNGKIYLVVAGTGLYEWNPLTVED